MDDAAEVVIEERLPRMEAAKRGGRLSLVCILRISFYEFGLTSYVSLRLLFPQGFCLLRDFISPGLLFSQGFYSLGIRKPWENKSSGGIKSLAKKNAQGFEMTGAF